MSDFLKFCTVHFWTYHKKRTANTSKRRPNTRRTEEEANIDGRLGKHCREQNGMEESNSGTFDLQGQKTNRFAEWPRVPKILLGSAVEKQFSQQRHAGEISDCDVDTDTNEVTHGRSFTTTGTAPIATAAN